MDTLKLRFVFDRKNITKKEPGKPALLQIEVYDTITRKKKYISTGIYLLKKQFSDKLGLTINNHPNAPLVKSKAQKIYNQIEMFGFSDDCKKLEDILNWDKPNKLAHTSVVEFIRSEMKKKTLTDSQFKHHQAFLSRFIEFGKIQTFKDVTYPNIEDFDYFLRKTISCQLVLYKRHKLFEKYLKKACKLKLMEENPYEDFEITRGDTASKTIPLTEEEVIRLKNFHTVGEGADKLLRVKDLFLFQCYTGLGYSDLKAFDRSYIITAGGVERVDGSRLKTKVSFVMYFLQDAKILAEKYNYKFPVMSNQKYNDYLKIIMLRLGINKKVTTHCGRHEYFYFPLKVSKLKEFIS